MSECNGDPVTTGSESNDDPDLSGVNRSRKRVSCMSAAENPF
ncbi:hypothetical protein SAMN05216323_100157 [Williamwhitmania taraxaci]|uniref:Uncharacterized protein n=1 Tax=Williamwhitmania taraxaci TaxID=1640674 RepID=A0A1G6GH88_9BACT|nr:hypothetical protein SAMN05216323_100157 [Williamwhitmania taraxaci]